MRKVIWAVTLAAALNVQADDSALLGGETLLAIEAARSAVTAEQRWQAALALETLAESDQPGAATALSMLIVDGRVEASPESARKWAERGHELGETDATWVLARLHADGIGGPRDLDQAAQLARQAAESGSPSAAMMVYELLSDTDRAEMAIRYLNRAADRGQPRAQLLLGMHYAAGELVERSAEEALFWLLLADAHGEPEAAPMIDSQMSALDGQRVERVIRAALEWEPR